VIVFTGALHIPREEAADLAATAGCGVAGSISKKTTILVVGDQDVRQLKGHEKSTKQRKAEELIAAGSPIRIIGEADFRSMMSWAKD
jgi:DNA polymerase III subunit epsilon